MNTIIIIIYDLILSNLIHSIFLCLRLSGPSQHWTSLALSAGCPRIQNGLNTFSDSVLSGDSIDRVGSGFFDGGLINPAW